MRYPFICERDDTYVEVERSIHDGPPAEVRCPECDGPLKRLYGSTPAIWRCEGSLGSRGSVGDYNKYGDKKEMLNRQWSRYYGEEPPKPAMDVPKNLSEPY